MVMDTGCIEVVVNSKPDTLIKILRPCAAILAVCFILSGFFVWWPFIFAGLIFCGVFYYANIHSVVDYEYAYVDREIRVARILQKSRRKEIAVFDLNKMTILTPMNAYEYDAYRNSDGKVLDYSSHDVREPDKRYCMVMSDRTKVILQLDGEYGRQLVDAVYHIAPFNVVKQTL